MSTVTQHVGDLFTSTAPALGHGVNTKGVMGAGIAVEFRRRYPQMYDHYRETCRRGALQPGDTLPWFDGPSRRFVFNMASQDKTGADAKLAWLESSLGESCATLAQFELTTLAVPRIGCGIGGLKWDDVLPVFELSAVRYAIHIEVWSLPEPSADGIVLAADGTTAHVATLGGADVRVPSELVDVGSAIRFDPREAHLV